MYYYESQRKRKQIKGSGLLDSIIGAVTAETVKKVATDTAKNVATKALTETGNRVSKKVIDKVILNKKGNGLSVRSKAVIDKYTPSHIVSIQDYVK